MWELIEQAMMKKGIKPTANEFRKLTGLSSAVTTKLRKNKKNIRYDTYKMICEKLDLNISDLVKHNEPMKDKFCYVIKMPD